MAILSFKKRFAGKVRNGRKRQTIRAFRKYPIKPGETLYLYTALRTIYATKLREVVCKTVSVITIYFNTPRIVIDHGKQNAELVDVPTGEVISQFSIERGQVIVYKNELNAFAVRDGFKDFEDMRAFWIAEHGVKKGKRKVILRPFKGILITW
jgi:hypothetical protein